jgi:hypothetical protein
MGECIAQCSNLEQEIHHTCSKLCILGFEPLIRTASWLPSTLADKLQAHNISCLG